MTYIPRPRCWHCSKQLERHEYQGVSDLAPLMADASPDDPPELAYVWRCRQCRNLTLKPAIRLEVA